MNEKNVQINAVCCHERNDPIRCTKNNPKDCVSDTVVRKAPLYFGLEYSPMRTDRKGASIPIDKPCSARPINNI